LTLATRSIIYSISELGGSQSPEMLENILSLSITYGVYFSSTEVRGSGQTVGIGIYYYPCESKLLTSPKQGGLALGCAWPSGVLHHVTGIILPLQPENYSTPIIAVRLIYASMSLGTYLGMKKT
jgi:hypothetical protein